MNESSTKLTTGILQISTSAYLVYQYPGSFEDACSDDYSCSTLSGLSCVNGKCACESE